MYAFRLRKLYGILTQSQVVWVHMTQFTRAFLHAVILLFNFSLYVVVVVAVGVVVDVVVGIHSHAEDEKWNSCR